MSVAIYLKGRNLCERNFCDLRPYLLKKMLPFTKKKNKNKKKKKAISEENTKTGHNSQEFLPQNTVILGYLIAKIRSAKIFFASNFFP